MDKLILKRLMASFLALALVLSGIILTTGPVSAADTTEKPKATLTTLWAGYDNDLNLFAVYEGNTDQMDITSVKSSKSSVIKVKKSGNTVWDVKLIPKKKGKSTITVKYKMDGQSYTDKIKMNVKKYPAQLKSLKAGSKKIKLKKNKYNCEVYDYSKKSVTVKAKASKGWKITGVLCMYIDNPNDENDISFETYSKSYVTKGKKISFPKRYKTMLVSIGMENSKGEWLEYVVYFHRDKK